jgi:hypothetical protein
MDVNKKKSRFFEHPVKGSFRWRRIWEREQRRKAENYQVVPALDSDALTMLLQYRAEEESGLTP